MKPQIATTIEQSARLITCGIKPETADMEWQPTGLKDDYRLNVGLFLADAVPAWSLSALVAFLPTEICDKFNYEYYLQIRCESKHSDYSITYREYWAEDELLISTRDKSFIEASVQMIEWLTTNGYPLNNI